MTMTRKCFIVKITLSIAIIECLLIQYTLAVGVTSYLVKAKKTISLKPDSSTILKVKNLLLTKPHPSLSNAYVATFEDVNYDIESIGTGLKTSLKDCDAFKKINQTLKLPFVVQKDKYGRLEWIIVSKKDDKTSVNIKLLTSVIMQINEATVKKNEAKVEFSAKTTERSLFGKCNTTYDGRMLMRDSFAVNVKYGINNCTETITYNVSDQPFLSTICNPRNQTEMNYLDKSRKRIGTRGDEISFENFSGNRGLIYKPFKGSNDAMTIKTGWVVQKLDPDEGKTGPDFNESEAETVTQLKYTPVVKEYVTNARDELRKVYKGLACAANHVSHLLALYEYAIDCQKS